MEDCEHRALTATGGRFGTGTATVESARSVSFTSACVGHSGLRSAFLKCDALAGEA